MYATARLFLPFLLLLVLFAWPSSSLLEPPTVRAASDHPFAYFPETGHNISFEIKSFFETYGGIEVFGLPLTEVTVDETTGFKVQYFERARFELRPDLPPEHYVTLTLLGSILTQHRTDGGFRWLHASPDPERDFYPESGHTLGGAFRSFWQNHGGLLVFGYPISEEFNEINRATGQVYLVQYFQRARFEYHPELRGTAYEVQLGQLGRQYLQQSPAALESTAPALPVGLLGKATTSFATSLWEREHNIARATTLFNGLVVPPSTEFSFNAVSDFSADQGFVDGYAIVNGRLEKVVAGGLCQVSTTMFRAVSNAGLEVRERHEHSSIVYFYENILGFDATVFAPYVDFRWFNDTPGPIYIHAEADTANSTVTFSLWGYHDGRIVEYEGPYVGPWVYPGAPIWQYDPRLPRGSVIQMVHGRPGTDVAYIRYVTWPDGTIKTTPYLTHYSPWRDYYVYGPKR